MRIRSHFVSTAMRSRGARPTLIRLHEFHFGASPIRQRLGASTDHLREHPHFGREKGLFNGRLVLLAF